jgi:succinate dehydrogenase / fumarate reductase cytochrome b subunit
MTDFKGGGGPPTLRPRPLSPHLGVWRWHVTMAASILHRVSGVSLYFGALVLTGWVLAMAEGPTAYQTYTEVLSSVIGRLVLFGLTVCVFYHMANGVRHIGQDFGKNLEPKRADFTAVAAIAFAVVAAAAVWVIAFLTGSL